MAIQLSIDILDNGYDEATNTSTATVIVEASYSGGSFNRNASGTLNINGVSYSFTASINGMEQEYGSETIYSQTVVIDRSVTDVVSCSVTVNAGGSSGTVGASGSLTLTGGSGGGGGDGGEDDGEDDGEYEEDENLYVFNCTLGQGVTVFAALSSYDTPADRYKLSESGTIRLTTNSYHWGIFATNSFPNDCDLTLKVTKNGHEYETNENSRGMKYVSVSPGTYTVIAYVTPKSLVRIDNGENFDLYAPCIDNGSSLDLYAPYVDNGAGWNLCK